MTYYKIMQNDLYQSGKVIDTSAYNYGLAAGKATANDKIFYDTLLQVSQISGVGFYTLMLFSSKIQTQVISQDLLQLFSLRDASLKIDLAEYMSVRNHSVVDIDLLDRLGVAAHDCDVTIASEEASAGLWEYLYELIRAKFFSSAPKRLESFFTCKDVHSVELYRKRHGLGEIICAVDATACTTVFEADMTILDDIAPYYNFKQAVPEIKRYWQQEHSKNPLIEVLLQGKITLLAPINL